LRRTTLAVSGELSLDMMDAVLDLLAQEKGWTSAQRANEARPFSHLSCRTPRRR
jgi:glycerol-3-phosphate dehydrogenase